MAERYDVITVGGGLGGSALATALARAGKRVLVLENETKFKDRVRGEQLACWGAAEARELGLLDLLLSTCANEETMWDFFFAGTQIQHRDMVASTPHQLPNLTFFHPEMQEALIAEAEKAGAEVRRGARVRGGTAGEEPSVTFDADGTEATATARLVVGADGRKSMVRSWGGFAVEREPDKLQIGGIMMEGSSFPADTAHMFFNPPLGTASPIFPQADGRARLYLVTRVDQGPGHSGDGDLPAFLDGCKQAGVPETALQEARYSGPLATFKGAATWVEHPYNDGVALLGDAAGHSDPSWGQGLSLTLRDARLLRDKLLETDDWDAAGHAYATQQNAYFMTTHTAESWFSELFYDIGPEADERRAKAIPGIAQDPDRLPDTFQGGPEISPLDEAAYRRMFGE